MGILERGKDGKRCPSHEGYSEPQEESLQTEVREHVQAGSALYTDSLKSYEGLTSSSMASWITLLQYVDGKIHTNGLENFWSLLKRGLKGTYVSASNPSTCSATSMNRFSLQ